MNIKDSITEIKGVGAKTASLFGKLNIYTVEDLLFYLPRGFEEFSEATFPTEDKNGKLVSINANLVAGSILSKRSGKYQISTVKMRSEQVVLTLRFFNMPYLKNVIEVHENYVLRGVLNVKKDRNSDENIYSMLQPKVIKESDYKSLLGTLQPLYPLTKGLSNKTIQKACSVAFDTIKDIPDYLTTAQCEKLQLYSLNEAIRKIHEPKNYSEYNSARRRIAFDEFFWFLYYMKRNKLGHEKEIIENPMLAVADTDRFIEQLPYHLTNDQIKVWADIEKDMEASVPMNRLLQGDVGSGKTIISFLTLLKACANGRQGALMAPTEVLAQQHFQGLKEYCEQYHLCIRPVLLLGSMSTKDKKVARDGILDGSYNVVIGTHAVMQKTVEYQNLSVVITDEQHRFGVNQREALRKKGDAVHVLVMSATPIPRTLALILYGDLAVSTIKELPSNRLAIKNCVVNDHYRDTAYNFMNKEIAAGHQIYIICPMVEMSEATEELENVIDYTEKIKKYFPNHIRISYLHGKMSLKEKEEIMNCFADGNIDILVSTTVIEVGINVPNATVIMIENAERYGLAQLHQLRGRVGRGDSQSYCIFMSSSNSKKNEERLEILNHSNDGFEIANRDLELRGPGQLGGIRQSGDLGFKFADIYEDHDVLLAASDFLNSTFEDLNKQNFNDINQFDHYHAIGDKIDTL